LTEVNIILVKWTTNGTRLWSKLWGTPGTDQGRDVEIDSNGFVYVTGVYVSVCHVLYVYVRASVSQRRRMWGLAVCVYVCV